jgi:hypothetical protein
VFNASIAKIRHIVQLLQINTMSCTINKLILFLLILSSLFVFFRENARAGFTAVHIKNKDENSTRKLHGLLKNAK